MSLTFATCGTSFVSLADKDGTALCSIRDFQNVGQDGGAITETGRIKWRPKLESEARPLDGTMILQLLQRLGAYFLDDLRITVVN